PAAALPGYGGPLTGLRRHLGLPLAARGALAVDRARGLLRSAAWGAVSCRTARRAAAASRGGFGGGRRGVLLLALRRRLVVPVCASLGLGRGARGLSFGGRGGPRD